MATATIEPATQSSNPRRQRHLPRYLLAFRTPRGIFAVVAIAVLTLATILAPVLFPGGYDQESNNAFASMSPHHLFGTDELGRDIFVRSVYGLRTDLTLVYLGVPISMVAGTLLGLLGFVAGWLGSAAQRIFDIIIGFPAIILGISIVLVLGTGWTALLIAIIIVGLPIFGRLARAALLEQQQREYVIAARTLGVGRWRILFRHVVPNAVDAIIVQGAVYLVHAVFFEASMSIVGLGIQPPQPSLGALLNTGMRYIVKAPTYVVGPILMLLILAFAFSLLTDSLNETVNRK